MGSRHGTFKPTLFNSRPIPRRFWVYFWRRNYSLVNFVFFNICISELVFVPKDQVSDKKSLLQKQTFSLDWEALIDKHKFRRLGLKEWKLKIFEKEIIMLSTFFSTFVFDWERLPNFCNSRSRKWKTLVCYRCILNVMTTLKGLVWKNEVKKQKVSS